MKKLLALVCLLSLCLSCKSANPPVTVLADKDGTLRAPTNFFRANSNLIGAFTILVNTNTGEIFSPINFWTSAQASNAVNALVTIDPGTNGLVWIFNTNQFTTINVTNISIKDGVYITNIVSLGRIYFSPDANHRYSVHASETTNRYGASGILSLINDWHTESSSTPQWVWRAYDPASGDTNVYAFLDRFGFQVQGELVASNLTLGTNIVRAITTFTNIIATTNADNTLGLTAIASGSVTNYSFNTNQFAVNGTNVSVMTGATVTNLTDTGTLNAGAAIIANYGDFHYDQGTDSFVLSNMFQNTQIVLDSGLSFGGIIQFVLNGGTNLWDWSNEKVTDYATKAYANTQDNTASNNLTAAILLRQLGSAALTNLAANAAYLTNLWANLNTNLSTTQFLRGDGTWQVPPGSALTVSSNGTAKVTSTAEIDFKGSGLASVSVVSNATGKATVTITGSSDSSKLNTIGGTITGGLIIGEALGTLSLTSSNENSGAGTREIWMGSDNRLWANFGTAKDSGIIYPLANLSDVTAGSQTPWASDINANGTNWLTNSIGISTPSNFALKHAGTNVLFYNSTNGAIGIGKVPGAYGLEVNGSIYTAGTISAGTFGASGSSYYYSQFGVNDNGSIGNVNSFFNSAGRHWTVKDSSGAWLLYLLPTAENGYFGIGITNPTAKLHVNGTAYVNGSLTLSNGVVRPWAWGAVTGGTLTTNGDNTISLTVTGGTGASNAVSTIYSNGVVKVTGATDMDFIGDGIASVSVVSNATTKATVTVTAAQTNDASKLPLAGGTMTGPLEFSGGGFVSLSVSNSSVLTEGYRSLWYDATGHRIYYASNGVGVALANYGEGGGSGIASNHATGLWFGGPMTVTNGVELRTNLNMYGGYTDDSNYERVKLSLTSSNVWTLNFTNIGTFTSRRDFMISGGGSNRMYFDNANGRVGIGKVPGAYALDVSGTMYANGDITSGSTLSSGGAVIAASGNYFQVSGRIGLGASAAGRASLVNLAALTNFAALTFGADNASHPAILISDNGSAATTNALFKIGNGTGTIINAVYDVVNGTNLLNGATAIDGPLTLAAAPQVTLTALTNNNDGVGTNFILNLAAFSYQYDMTNHCNFVHATNGPAAGFARHVDITIINNSGANYDVRVPTGWTNTVYSPAAPLTITNGTQVQMLIKARGGNTPITYRFE